MLTPPPLAGTTELRETILLHLPLRDLLLAKRISLRFQDVMAVSLRIRRALFFEPLPVPTATHINAVGIILRDDPHGWGPLPAGFPRHKIVNPLLDHFLTLGQMLTPTSIRSTVKVVLDSPSFEQLRSRNDAASWRRMLVIQPHASPFYVGDFFAASEAKSLRNGLRMNELYDIHLAHFDKSERHRRWVSTFEPCSNQVMLHTGLLWAMGGYREECLRGDARKNMVDEICGWDIVRFGRDGESQELMEYGDEEEDRWSIAGSLSGDDSDDGEEWYLPYV